MSRLTATILGLGLLLGATARAETVEGPDLWVIAPDDARELAVRVRDAFPEMLADVEAWLGTETAGRVVIHLCDNLDDMRDMLGSRLTDEHLGACAPPGIIGIRIDMLSPIPGMTLEDILRHETVHHVLSQLPRPAPPRWFEEGLALRHDRDMAEVLRVALDELGLAASDLEEHLPPLATFTSYGLSEAEADSNEVVDDAGDEVHPLAVYLAGLYALDHFLDRCGDAGLRRLIALLDEGRAFDSAFLEVVGLDVEQFDTEARRALLERHRTSWTLPPALFLVGLVLLLLATWIVSHRCRRGAASEG